MSCRASSRRRFGLSLCLLPGGVFPFLRNLRDYFAHTHTHDAHMDTGQPWDEGAGWGMGRHTQLRIMMLGCLGQQRICLARLARWVIGLATAEAARAVWEGGRLVGAGGGVWRLGLS